MLKRLLERRREEEGFTLIELMVVVLIIGILIAIALPTFLGARKRAQDRAAQSDVRTAVAAAKTAYTDDDSYVNATAALLPNIESSIDYDTLASASPTFRVSVAVGNAVVGDNQAWGAARMSASGTCFFLKDVAVDGGAAPNANAGTFYGSSTAVGCSGANAFANATSRSW